MVVAVHRTSYYYLFRELVGVVLSSDVPFVVAR
jgi:hypothetical protein